MENNQLDIAIEEYIEKALSKRKTCLEATKKLASDVWKLICDKKENTHLKTVHVIQYFNGDINIRSDNSEIKYFFSSYCKDKEFLDLIYIIAENSNFKGKVFSDKNSEYRRISLYFK